MTSVFSKSLPNDYAVITKLDILTFMSLVGTSQKSRFFPVKQIMILPRSS